MSEKWRQSETCIVINDKSQGSINKPLSCNVLHYYTLIIQSAGERIFKIGALSEFMDKSRPIVFRFDFFLTHGVVAKLEEQSQQQQ